MQKDCSKVAELDEEECDANQGIAAAAGMSAANLNFRQIAACHQQSNMRGVLPARNKLCTPCPSTTQALLQRKPLHRRCLTNPLTKQRRDAKVLPRTHARKSTCRSHKTAASITCAAATGCSVFSAAIPCACCELLRVHRTRACLTDSVDMYSCRAAGATANQAHRGARKAAWLQVAFKSYIIVSCLVCRRHRGPESSGERLLCSAQQEVNVEQLVTTCAGQ